MAAHGAFGALRQMPNLGQFFSTVWRVVSTGSDEAGEPQLWPASSTVALSL